MRLAQTLRLTQGGTTRDTAHWSWRATPVLGAKFGGGRLGVGGAPRIGAWPVPAVPCALVNGITHSLCATTNLGARAISKETRGFVVFVARFPTTCSGRVTI